MRKINICLLLIVAISSLYADCAVAQAHGERKLEFKWANFHRRNEYSYYKNYTQEAPCSDVFIGEF